MDEQLERHPREQVVEAAQVSIEAALVEEARVELESMDPKPRRSGYFERTLDTQYGRNERLLVPKPRSNNKERNWTILERYQRSLGRLLDFAGYLYIMGLSIRDLQEALYFLLGTELSRTAVNRITLDEFKIDRAGHQRLVVRSKSGLFRQRCITRKVRGMKPYLTYKQLPQESATPPNLC